MSSQTFRMGQLLSLKKGRLHRCRVVLAVQGCSQIGSPLSFNRDNRKILLRALLRPRYHYHYNHAHRDPLQTRHTISKTYNPLWQLRFRHTSLALTLYPRCLMEQTTRTGQMDNLLIHNKGRLYKTPHHSSSGLKCRGHRQQTPCLLPRNNQGTGRRLLHSMQIRRRSPVCSSANHTSTPAHNRRAKQIKRVSQINLSGHNLYQANHKIPGNRDNCGRWDR